VVDFAKADPLAVPGGFDLIVDLVARRPMLAYRRALAPGGRLVVVARANRCLPELADLLQTGELVPVIDSTWPLEAVPDAMRKLAAADAFGKLVIDVADADER
jgi:NADPH:quinone reductase-like Zn-dependent oxidoreductase